MRHGLAVAEHRARRRGEALLLDDGAGRVASHRGVAQAGHGSGRHGRARSSPRQPCPPDARGRHAGGEGLPDAGVLRAADHLAVPDDRKVVAGDGARRRLQPPGHGRRHPSRRRHGVRARAASEPLEEDEPEAGRRCEPAATGVRGARDVAAARARLDRPGHGVPRRRPPPRGPRARRPPGGVAGAGRQRRRAHASSRP